VVSSNKVAKALTLPPVTGSNASFSSWLRDGQTKEIDQKTRAVEEKGGSRSVYLFTSPATALTSSPPIAETSFTCLFCHHDKSVTVKIVRKEGYGQLNCKVCGQSYQSKINRAHLSHSLFAHTQTTG
jgi:hypothetical protein